MDLVIIFVVMSAFLNAVMVVLKEIKLFGDNKVFKRFKPAIPPLVGLVIGLIGGLAHFEVSFTYGAIGAASGFLCGTMSTTSYDLFEAIVKKKAEKV